MTRDKLDPDDRQIDDRATGIGAGGEDDDKVADGDADKAHRAAKQILDESEQRTLDNATVDLEDDSVPRRTPDERLDP